MRLVTRSPPAAYLHLAGSRRTRKLFCTITSLRHHVPAGVRLKVGSSGQIVLNILKSKKASETNLNHVLIVLPSGPALQIGSPQVDSLSNTKSFVSRLSEALPLTTIVTLNYRLSSSKHPYPVPIHDTATGFTYILNPNSPHNAGRPPRISLYGTNVGGSLALMLALTSPNLIQSLAVLEPFVDWAGLDERRLRAKDSLTQDAIAHVLTARSRLFPSPSAFFDPFASPILFLRAPGRDTPTSNSSPLTEKEDKLCPERNNDTDAFGPYDDDMTSAIHETPPKRRKVLRRWPSNGLPEEVILPYAKIMLRVGGGLHGILRDQGREMADCMRKACFFGREKGAGEERVKAEILPECEGMINEVIARVVRQVQQDMDEMQSSMPRRLVKRCSPKHLD